MERRYPGPHGNHRNQFWSLEMTYDIIVRFPSKELADEFCGQMSDGFGEGFCDFTPWDHDPANQIHGQPFPRKVVEDGKPVFFVDSIFEQ